MLPETLGKVPVGLRRYISDVVILARPAYSATTPSEPLPYAYTRAKLGVLTFTPSCSYPQFP